ncbi:MAG: nuclear transport factor 2 family protein [Solirubrobacterales bacterium]
MSEPNIELIGRALGLIDDGDITALIELLDPMIEWRPPEQGTLDEAYYGHQGVRKLFAQLTEAWDSFEHQPVKLVSGDQVTIVVTRLKLHAQASDVQVDEVWAYAVTVADGKISYVEMYTNPEQAIREHTSSLLESAPNWPG